MENTETQDVEITYPTAHDAEGWYYANGADEAGGIETKIWPNGSEAKRVHDKEQYPTQPAPDGWYYENEGLCALGIDTLEDKETEEKKMRVQLSRGRVAIMKELDAKENKKVQQIAGVGGKDAKRAQERLGNAMIAVATTITDKDGNKVVFVMEDLETAMFKGKDINRLATACNTLNF